MSFVIYNLKTWQQAYGNRSKSYATERAAKGVRTKGLLDPKVWGICTSDFWYENEPMVTVYSIFDLKKERPIQIRASSRGGSCDPSMELYHTM